MDDRPNQQVEDITRSTPLPITPRQVHSIHTAGPAALFAQFRATTNTNKGLTASPVKTVRHGRSKSLTEGGSKSSFMTADSSTSHPHNNSNTSNSHSNTPLDADDHSSTSTSTTGSGVAQHSLATPDTLTPSTSPRGMVVRVPPNTPAKSPGLELRTRVSELQQESRDLRDQCDTLTRENERLKAELLSRGDFSKSEAEQFIQNFEDMTRKLMDKEEDLRVLNIELKEKSKQLTELTNELAPYTSATDLKARVAELEKNSKELDSSLNETRSQLQFVELELQAANDTATELSGKLDETIAGVQSNTSNLEAEIERWKLLAQELGTVHEENESLQKQLQTQRERAEQLEHERDTVRDELTNQNTTLHNHVTDLESQLTQLRADLSRAESAVPSAEQQRTQQQQYESVLREVNELRLATAALDELRKEIVRKDDMLTRVKSTCSALEQEKLKLHDQLKISEVTVERLTDQLTRGDTSVKQRLAQLDSELKHVTEQRDQFTEQLNSQRDRVTALESDIKARDQRCSALAEQLASEQRTADTLRTELKHVTSEQQKRFSELTAQVSELTKARDSFRDATKKLEQQLDSAQKSATSAAEKHKSEVTALRDELQRAGTSLQQATNQHAAAVVPPHTDMIAALKTRSALIKNHVTKLRTKTVVPATLSLTSALITVLLIAVALVLGLAVLSRDQFHKLVLHAQRYLPK